MQIKYKKKRFNYEEEDEYDEDEDEYEDDQDYQVENDLVERKTRETRPSPFGFSWTRPNVCDPFKCSLLVRYKVVVLVAILNSQIRTVFLKFGLFIL